MGNDHYRKRYEEFESKIIDGITSYEPISSVLGLEDEESDIDKFNLAFEQGNIPKLVELCYSQTPFKQTSRIHPWAKNPQTIGALAATQLANYASRSQGPECIEDIRMAGGVEVLVDMLRSTEEDRKHAGAIALTFMSSGSSKCCEELYELKVFPDLIQGMKSTLDPFRATCALASRNIYHLDIQYRKEFMKLGGLVALVALLDPIDDSGELYLTQLEAIYHLEDFIMDGVEEIPELITYVKVSGALPKLQNLEKGNIKEVSKTARSLLIRLLD